MLIIDFNNRQNNKYKYSVINNNNSDLVKMICSMPTAQKVYIKVQSKDGEYIDKILATEYTIVAGNYVVYWNMPSKSTAYKKILLQLQTENSNGSFVAQSPIVEIELLDTINADHEIPDNYPSVLTSLQNQINALSGGGSSSVEIERVWLSYDWLDESNTVAVAVANKLIGKNTDGDYISNYADRMFFNFKTTPISPVVEEEIKNGRFVIRLDYPIGAKTPTHIKDDGFVSQTPSHPSGMGVRSFAHNFDGVNTNKQTVLLNSLIFVNSNDVKTNEYGEKYIHKKISYIDLINKIVSVDNGHTSTLNALTFELLNDEYVTFAGAYCDERILGVPITDMGSSSSQTFYSQFYKKLYQRNGLFYESGELVKQSFKKLNPAYTTTCLLELKPTDYTSQKINLYSPYFRTKIKAHSYLLEPNDCFVLKRNNNNEGYFAGSKSYNRSLYMSFKPRCCIIDENYQTKTLGSVWLKTYPQSEQQVRIRFVVFYDTGNAFGNGYAVAVTRAFISQK